MFIRSYFVLFLRRKGFCRLGLYLTWMKQVFSSGESLQKFARKESQSDDVLFPDNHAAISH